jgi:diguanylate cyclase (GGDEF)-like protein/PAS domain S-box-containing protein
MEAATEPRAATVDELRLVIAALRAQARRRQAALDSVAQGVCVFDRSGRLLSANRRYAEIYRLPADQAGPGATLAPTDPCRALRAQLGEGGEAQEKDWCSVLPDGRTVHVHLRPAPQIGWAAIHDDVTSSEATVAVGDERISLRSLLDVVPDYLWIKDVEGRFLVVNRALAADNGFARAADMIGRSDADIHSPEAARVFRASELEIVATGRPMVNFAERVVDRNGVSRWLSSTKVPLRNQRNEIVGLIGAARDITTFKLAEALRDGQAQILEMIATNAPLEAVLDRLMRVIEAQSGGVVGSVLLLDEEGRHLRRGAAPSLPEDYWKAVDGVSIDAETGACATAAHRRETVVVTDTATDPLWAGRREEAERCGLRSCRATPILSPRNAVLGVLALYSATPGEPTPIEARLVEFATRIAAIAIDRKRAEDHIQFLATHDALTGLPNRSMLKERLGQALRLAERRGCWATAVFVDLDHFKLINDSLGHSAGDELLKIVADRMVRCVRASDMVARIGGDEFVIVFFDQAKNFEALRRALRKIQRAIGAPIRLGRHTHSVTGSFGVATYPNDGVDADALLANADAAMYRAKRGGRDKVQFCTPGLNGEANGPANRDAARKRPRKTRSARSAPGDGEAIDALDAANAR